jgi:hypothetical protein
MGGSHRYSGMLVPQGDCSHHWLISPECHTALSTMPYTTLLAILCDITPFHNMDTRVGFWRGYIILRAPLPQFTEAPFTWHLSSGQCQKFLFSASQKGIILYHLTKLKRDSSWDKKFFHGAWSSQSQNRMWEIRYLLYFTAKLWALRHNSIDFILMNAGQHRKLRSNEVSWKSSYPRSLV